MSERRLVLNRGSTLDRDEPRYLIAKKIRETIKSPCQRILLIHPQHIPEEHFSIDKALNSRYWSYQPYGCGVLCHDLELRGYQADILDLNFEMLEQAHRLKQNFLYSDWKDRLRGKLKEFNPDIIGISCMFTMSHMIVKNIADAAKEYSSTLPVIGGGVHLSNARKNALSDCSSIDFIGIYECDRSFPDLIDFVNGKLPVENLVQISSIVGSEFFAIESRATPDANEIEATPTYYSLPVDKYSGLGQIGTYGFIWKRQGRKAASVLANRGCRAKCSFCSVREFNGLGVRERTTQGVLDEMRDLHEVYGISHFTWLDDDLLFDKKRTLDLFNGITKNNMDITWDASNGLIAAFITEENMQAMSESGCIGFNLGIESGNPEILRHVHKPGTVDSFRKAKTIIDKYPHIFVKSFLIIGFPNETISQLMDTVNLSLELDLDWHAIQILNPLPSTEIYDEMIALGLIQDKLETSDVAYVFGPHGKQHLREQREKLKAEHLFNLFTAMNMEEVPNEDQLKDYWFLMDYKLNYERILGISEPVKLNKRALQLEDICNRIAPNSAIAHLFYGITKQKLGDTLTAKEHARYAEGIVLGNDQDSGSAYWKKRFEALDLHTVLNRILKT